MEALFEKIALAKAEKMFWSLSDGAKKRLLKSGVLRSKKTYADGILEGSLNKNEGSKIGHTGMLTAMSTGGYSALGNQINVPKGKLQQFASDITLKRNPLRSKGNKALHRSATIAHEADELLEEGKGNFAILGSNKTPVQRLGIKSLNKRTNSNVPNIAVGQHNNLAVLGREANLQAKTPYDTGMLKARKNTGEYGLIKGITGKKPGVDIMTRKDLRKLRNAKHDTTSYALTNNMGFAEMPAYQV